MGPEEPGSLHGAKYISSYLQGFYAQKAMVRSSKIPSKIKLTPGQSGIPEHPLVFVSLESSLFTSNFKSTFFTSFIFYWLYFYRCALSMTRTRYTIKYDCMVYKYI